MMEKCKNHDGHWFQTVVVNGNTVLVCVHCGDLGPTISVARLPVWPFYPDSFPIYPYVPYTQPVPFLPLPVTWEWGNQSIIVGNNANETTLTRGLS